MNVFDSLLAKHSLISDQVSKQQVEVILRELTRVLDGGVEGAVVEFGCYIGTTSLFIRRLLDARGQSAYIPFHVYDSFEGLPTKSTWDASITGEQFTAGELAVSKKQFLREFQKAHLQPPIVHKGWFKDLSPTDIPDKIAFAFLDGDFYESIRDSLRLVVPHMAHGSTIIIDDYSREALPGAAKATHEYFSTAEITVVHNLGVIHL
ncbi:class I SAM-dependent methyltransferase [Candidatus Saccharibacteria bacterium]|nr:MAG: class I SAM-dependent methyltransferase [Candidatus Saccharibacteria bacterium]